MCISDNDRKQLIKVLELVNTREQEQKQYMQELENLQGKRWGVG